MDCQSFKNVFICSNVELGFFYEICRCNLDQRYRYNLFYTVSGEEYRKFGSASQFRRVSLRLKMFFLYPIQLILKILKSSQSDIFVVSSNCFFAPLIALIVSVFTGNKTVFLLYDLYPEALVAGGVITEFGIIHKILGKVIFYTIKKSRGVVYLGAVLMSYTEKTWAANSNSICIDVGNGNRYNTSIDKSVSEGGVWVRYGGQLGELHAAKTVAYSLQRYIKKCRNNDLKSKIKFDFFSAGSGHRYLKSRIQSPQVKFSEPLIENWQNDSLRYQCGLVTLSPEGAVICLPSKVYGMLASGQAVIGICPVWSDLATIINANKCGWVINNSNLTRDELYKVKSLNDLKKFQRLDAEIADDFCAVLREIENNPSKLYECRQNSLKAAKEKYDAAVIVQEWNNFIGRME